MLISFRTEGRVYQRGTRRHIRTTSQFPEFLQVDGCGSLPRPSVLRTELLTDFRARMRHFHTQPALVASGSALPQSSLPTLPCV